MREGSEGGREGEGDGREGRSEEGRGVGENVYTFTNFLSPTS